MGEIGAVNAIEMDTTSCAKVFQVGKQVRGSLIRPDTDAQFIAAWKDPPDAVRQAFGVKPEM